MDVNGANPVRIFLLLIFVFRLTCEAANTIPRDQSIADGQTIVSSNGNFALGFFSPQNSSFRYVGIWYNKISVKSVAWVANRDKPISNNTGVLRIGTDGNLLVLDGNGTTIWSTNVSLSSSDTVAVLMDTGNLLLSSSSDVGDVWKSHWQSFNYPTDTYLPGMRVRVNAAMGENHAFTSWKYPGDPSPGNFSLGVDPRGAPQIVVWEGSKRIWRSGHWNLQIFTGVPNMVSNYLYGFKLSPHEPDGSMYFTYVPSTSTDLLRFWIRWDGVEEELRWVEAQQYWSVYHTQPSNYCENYNRCGNFGICSLNDETICSCMDGYEPKNALQWNKGNWSEGCERRVGLLCQRNSSVSGGDGDGFLAAKCLKFPDFADQVPSAGDKEACKEECMKNCTCNAYAFADGIGCLIWNEDLVDIQHFDKTGETLYIRLAGSELGDKSNLSIVAIIMIVIGGLIVVGINIWLVWRYKTQIKDMPKISSLWWKGETSNFDISKSGDFSMDVSRKDGDGNSVDPTELQQFNFKSIVAATDNFSEENELGKGGFGTVYKGKLQGGQEVAVKRLSRMSGQGVEEFKNEIILIAKLQHRNLVKLLGCCIEEEEKILIYEYMPNKSLDYFLFDPAKQAQLDWRKRFTVIEGIARGLLYLHRDSRLRIIHRDLKASNILLDEEINPKISDFGMARIFGGNQNDEENTLHVVGTYGYMSPEYAMEGLFSVKSDVYSFGVLLLEIVSGRRNTSFRSENSSLIGYTWSLWNESRAIELIDPVIKSSCSIDEALRCIQVGVLCVQDSPIARPTMSAVVLMLEAESATLPLPRQPTYTSMRNSIDSELYMECHDLMSLSDVTVSTVHGR